MPSFIGSMATRSETSAIRQRFGHGPDKASKCSMVPDFEVSPNERPHQTGPLDHAVIHAMNLTLRSRLQLRSVPTNALVVARVSRREPCQSFAMVQGGCGVSGGVLFQRRERAMGRNVVGVPAQCFQIVLPGLRSVISARPPTSLCP